MGRAWLREDKGSYDLHSIPWKSWLFYFRALQLGSARRVAPMAFVIFEEEPSLGTITGGALIAAGVLVVAFVR